MEDATVEKVKHLRGPVFAYPSVVQDGEKRAASRHDNRLG